MDFDDSPEEAAFRAEVRAWLAENAPPSAPRDDLAAAKAWQAQKYDAGYAAITWPRDYGGRDGKPIEALLYRQEEARHRLPGEVFGIGLGMCIPIVRAYGGAEQKARYISKALRGEEVWCQLFSEPSGGSDVAAARTRAVRQGDHWRVTGQKVWTSYAHLADYGILLARTDPKVPKHRGLTMFVVDLRSPGVEVRPIHQLSGRSEFNEVFFDEVVVPDSERLGDVGQGWQVAISTLMHERQTAGGGLGFVDHGYIQRLASRTELDGKPAIEDRRVRERIVDMYLNTRALGLLNLRAQTALSKGETPGPEQSIGKAVAAAQGQQASYLAMELMGEAGLLTSAELGGDWDRVERSWTWGAAMRIAGGTDEILRNIIAERVLGLPPEIRTDKDVPFDQLES